VAISWATIEFTYERVVWWLGWLIVRVLTLGNFPRNGFHEFDRAPPLTRLLVGVPGIVPPILAVFLLQKNYYFT
jgi:hypothetical protein